MAIYTKKEIEKFRKRWEGKTNTVNEFFRYSKRGNQSSILEAMYQILRENGIESILKGEMGRSSFDLRGTPRPGDGKNARLFNVHMEGARLSGANFKCAVFARAHLEDANLDGMQIDSALFEETHIEGADFQNTKVLGTTFECVTFLPRWRDLFFNEVFLNNMQIPGRKKLIFKNIKYINWMNVLNHIFNRWFYTNFEGVRIDDADTVMAPDLYRYVEDQQYLYSFRQTHPRIYWVWKIFSDCGGKLSVVFFWSMVCIGLFALLFSGLGCIDPQPLEKLGGFWKWIFVSFDVFSNLGIRNTHPLNSLGVILMICESLTGFMMLGMLISVLQNRFARRS